MPNVNNFKGCQVAGCDVDMDAQKSYNQKKRCCAAHMAAQAVLKRGCGPSLFRYCFQCGKLEELSRFDGAHRSCRERLVQRKQRSVARRASSQSLLLLPQAQSPAGSGLDGASPASIGMATSSCPPSPAVTAASPSSTTSSGGSPHVPGSCCAAAAPCALACAGSDASQLSCYMSGCMDELLQQAQGPASQPCKTSPAATPESDACYEQLLDQLMQGMAESGVVFVEAPADTTSHDCTSAGDEALAEELARLLEQELQAATAELAAAASPAPSQAELQLQVELMLQMEQARKAACLAPAGPAQHAAAGVAVPAAQWQQARLQALKDQFNSLQALLQQLQACMTSMQLA